jgi:hypothetical protein
VNIDVSLFAQNVPALASIDVSQEAGKQHVLAHALGVLQGSCRVSRVFKLLFSLPAAPSLG